MAADGSVVAVADLVAGAPDDVLGLIDGGPALWRSVAKACSSASGGVALESARLLAPIPRPRRNVVCVGLNYHEHVEENRVFGVGGTRVDAAGPAWPVFFSKNPATVNAPDAPVRFPAPLSTQLDWEAELAVVVGIPGAAVAEERALDHVFGYTAANDLSVRDIQVRPGKQWYLGKNFDGHLPLGPWIVTADELGDPHALRIATRVNGVTKQDARTSDLIFNVPRLLHDLSEVSALEAGDIIITGTPSGVGIAHDPPEYLKPGDVVEVEIERIGILRNHVV